MSAGLPSVPSVLVVTVVHHPADARIAHRQIPALLDAGWRVTYAAPFTATDAAQPAHDGLRTIDLPRASGRRRLAAWRAARSLLRRFGPEHDLVLLHDPELLTAVAGTGLDPARVVWDVHEDPAAALRTRDWIPAPLRGPVSSGVRAVERRAEARHPLLLAEQGYRARFRRDHPVIPNSAPVPAVAALPEAATRGPDGLHRVVYVGSITRERGVQDLAELAASLAADVPRVARLEIVGQAHGEAAEILRTAEETGGLRWLGRLDRDAVPAFLEGALAGLSLLHDLPNYRSSMPTKLIDYLAHGLPVITTPLPEAVRLVERSGGGVLVPFGGVDAALRTVHEWARDVSVPRRLGKAGHTHVLNSHNWDHDKADFTSWMAEVVRDS